MDCELVGNKKTLNHIRKSLSLLDECIKREDMASFEKQIGLIANYFGSETREDHCKKVYETINDQRFHPAFNMDELNELLSLSILQRDWSLNKEALKLFSMLQSKRRQH